MNKRGVALITSFMMMGLLLMLLGAFLQVNRGHVWLLNASEGRQVALAACRSVHDYVLYRLEHDYSWGSTDFKGRLDSNNGLEVEELDGQRRIRGSIESTGAAFEVDIDNNLMGVSASGDVPANCARVNITARALGATRSVTSLVHVAPVFDSSALTRGDLLLDVDRFNMRSKDPWRNQLRAEGTVSLPQVVTGDRARSLEVASNKMDPKGLIWAKGQIKSAGTPIDSSKLTNANQNFGGRLVPQAQQHFEIYDLQSESIKVPENAATIPAGHYRFAKAEATYTVDAEYGEGQILRTQTTTHTKEIDVLEFYPPNSSAPSKVYRAASRIDDLGLQKNITAKVRRKRRRAREVDLSLTGAEVTELELEYEEAGVQVNEVLADFIDLDGSGRVKADLLNQKIVIEPDTTVNVDGPFAITSADPVKKPRLQLGSEQARAAIIANGDIEMSNAISDGVGTLVSKKGDVNLRPVGTDFDIQASDPMSGLVLFAEGNVHLANPEENGGNWNFQGLVYARKNFSFDAGGARCRLEGTVVAREGSIAFNNGGETDFVYNPEYVRAILKSLPENRTQLERLYWKE